MGKITCNVSVSADGFIAGPAQSRENPVGEGGLRVHQWHFDAEGVDAEVVERWQNSPGAYVMGRNMFGPIRGEWDEDWRGWWGEDPPYHAPVFVLTHYPHEPIPMAGGTTFHFVTDGIDAALEQARAVAGDQNVEIAGGAATINAYLAARAIDELHLHVAPVVLGAGERLFNGVPNDLELAPVAAIASPAVTHITYHVGGG